MLRIAKWILIDIGAISLLEMIFFAGAVTINNYFSFVGLLVVNIIGFRYLDSKKIVSPGDPDSPKDYFAGHFPQKKGALC